ncbi:hypothetical protein HPP92_019739 [Vanilla planifolia]|uniref:Protein PLASTID TRANSCRIPTIONALLY ACTIVE 7 n=1 Tax=Vanilla planifolia TaxID=51239 RepID=A0A835Q3E9_VANPL|nr:hypothetical protein HPP92_020186 [Vanilla planifolia]KAG0465575.1 hypothetical protein HPP92_019739 [Vanilla planifolia]
MALSSAFHIAQSPVLLPPPYAAVAARFSSRSFGIISATSQNEDNGGRGSIGGGRQRIWRRRKLSKRDDQSVYKMERIPFLEEQVRIIRESGKIMALDINRMLLSEENRFAFVNEVAEEAKEYLEKNRDEYGTKKAILHVLSDRMNDAGFQRSEAYIEPDPYKPGPNFLRSYQT